MVSSSSSPLEESKSPALLRCRESLDFSLRAVPFSPEVEEVLV